MARSDYEHWNEEADHVWWQEEGRHSPDDQMEAAYDPMQDTMGYPGRDFCAQCGSDDPFCGCGDDGWET